MPDQFDDIRIIMDLPRLGELIAAIAHKLTVIRDIEPPDFDGPEMRELAVHGWRHVCLMNDRAEFTASVMKDLELLETPGQLDPQPIPQHRSEFGL